MTTLLRDLRTQNANASSSTGLHCAAPETFSAPSAQTSSPHHLEFATGPIVEGQSSLSAHSVFVKDFVRNLVRTDAPGPPDQQIRRTLEPISDIENDVNNGYPFDDPYLPQKGTQSNSKQRSHKLPPLQKAAPLIRLAKAQRLAGSGWVYEYITMQPFGDLCLEVYYADGVSSFDFISVNAGLQSLFWDYAHAFDISEEEKEQCIAHSLLCRDNLETELANLPLLLPASSKVVAALLFAAFYAIGSSKPLLCWSLASKASELCQTLGYHRKAPLRDSRTEDTRYTQLLFWSTYYVDKSLSLRLGRASTIPEWDISIDLPSPPSNGQEPLLAYFVLWIKLARCQGNIYESLYSPGSINQPDSVRNSRTEILVSTLHDLEQETDRTMNDWFKISKQNSGEGLMNFYATSDAVLRLSLLTHVYRAAPRASQSSTTFSRDCIEVARATIAKHHECMAIIHGAHNLYFSTYIHWTLLFAPFVPIIVLFCNIMETQDQTDLERLQAFLKSIEMASIVSAPAAKMQRLFQVLYNVAARYIELQTQSMAEQTEIHLASLGLPRARTLSTTQQHAQSVANYEDLRVEDSNALEIGDDEFQWAVNPMFWLGNEAELENWFFQNQSSMETLQNINMSSRSSG